MKDLLIRAIISLIILGFIYCIIGILSLVATFSSYVILEYIKTTGNSIFTISIKDVAKILSVFETDNEWVFLKSFVQSIILNLPFSDTIDLAGSPANSGNVFSAIGIIAEYLFRIITGKGFTTQTEKIQMWAELFPSIVKATLATLLFDLLLLPKKILNKFNQDKGFQFFLNAFLILLYVYIAIGSFYLSAAIIECIAVEFKNDSNILYGIYYGILLLCLFLRVRFLKTFLWKLLLDILFSLGGSILLYFLCNNFMTINWTNTSRYDQVFIAVILFTIHFSITCVYFWGIDALKKWLTGIDEKSKSLTFFKKGIKNAK